MKPKTKSKPKIKNRKELTLIAIYHLHLQIISRGGGKSAVSAAAYRSGSQLHSEYDGGDHDYRRKGGIVHSEILLPTNAPAEYADRNTLWNAVEKVERYSSSALHWRSQHKAVERIRARGAALPRRSNFTFRKRQVELLYKNAQLAREVEIALPVELSLEQQIPLVRQYIQTQFTDRGMIADYSIHEPSKKTPNPHVHIMLTMRPLNEDKSWGAKLKTVGKKTVYTTDWNDQGNAEIWRAAWADAVNAELEKHGHAERIDHRSYERQGVEQIPTVHLGVSVTQMERRGIVTERGDLNREIVFTNSQIKQIRARANNVKSWLDENKNIAPPPLYDLIMAQLHNPEKSKLTNLQEAAKTLAFLEDNHIGNIFDLADKVDEIQRGCTDAYERKKKVERRVTTLDKHAAQCKNFTANRSVMQTYTRLKSEAEAAEKSAVGSLNPFAKSKAEKARKAA